MEALAILQAGPAPVDLLIADIRMPRMRGDQLALQARELGLARHVLFISGYDTHPEAVQLLGDLLMKPFLPGALTAAVARARGGTTPQ
jgi:two-component SAPR family response regulator